MVAHGFVDHLPACFGFAHEAFVEFAVEVVELALELAVVVEASGVDCGLGDGAAGFAGVATVAEAAISGDSLYFFEADIELVWRGPQLNFAQAGHVDE